MIKRHPEPDLLVEYVSGSLSLAPCISVTTHLQYCEKCRSSVDSLKDIGGNLLDGFEATDVSDDLLDRVLDCIDSEEEHVDTPAVEAAPSQRGTDQVADDLPAFVKGILPAGELDWRSLTSSLKVAPLPVGEDSFELSLHKIHPGGKAPEHDHRGREITVVLKGSFSDEDGVYQPGDFIVREPGDMHRPFAARNEECICLSVLEAPIKLTGVKRVLNPFLSFSPR